MYILNRYVCRRVCVTTANNRTWRHSAARWLVCMSTVLTARNCVHTDNCLRNRLTETTAFESISVENNVHKRWECNNRLDVSTVQWLICRKRSVGTPVESESLKATRNETPKASRGRNKERLNGWTKYLYRLEYCLIIKLYSVFDKNVKPDSPINTQWRREGFWRRGYILFWRLPPLSSPFLRSRDFRSRPLKPR